MKRERPRERDRDAYVVVATVVVSTVVVVLVVAVVAALDYPLEFHNSARCEIYRTPPKPSPLMMQREREGEIN